MSKYALQLLQKGVEGVRNVIQRKETVGKDAIGNIYFRYKEFNDGKAVERREVSWHQAYMLYDPNQVPPEWRMWLKKLRDDPPTDEEMAKSAAKSKAFQEKVLALDEEERVRQLRQQARGSQAQQSGAQGPDLSHMLHSMGGSPRSTPPSPNSSPGTSRDGGGEGSGSGDSFKPGAWQPGK